MAPSFECNDTEHDWPDGLPPKWCQQEPMDGVRLRYNTSRFTLTNSSRQYKLCEVQRSVQGHTTVDRQKFVVRDALTFNNGHGNITHQDGVSAQIEWLASPDRGSLELISVVDAPLDGPLYGLNHAEIVETPVGKLLNMQVVNHWAVPLYICIDVTDPGNTLATPQQYVVDPGGRFLFWGNEPQWKPTVKWRIAVPQRLSMYGPEPTNTSLQR